MKTMIRNKSILFSALASVMLTTACSSEEDMASGGSNELTGRVMYATGAYNDGSNPQTRMSYEDDFATNHLTLTWSEADAFSAFVNGNATKYDFIIQAPQSGTYTASESFKCDNFASEVIDGTIIDAIYPAVTSESGSVNPQNVTLSLAAQTQDGDKSTVHLKNYDYMVGHAIYNSNTPDELNFNFKDKGDGNSGRLASIYRIKVALPSTVTSVSKIEISCTDVNNNSSLVTSEKVNFTNGSTSALADAKGAVTLNITNGTPTDGEFVAYAMLFPSAVKTRTITVTATDGGAEKTFTDTKTYDNEVIYTRGQFKYIDVDFGPKKNFKSAYVQADFKIWSEDNCKDAPSLDDIKKYLGAGVYWDNGDAGLNQQTYTVPNNNDEIETYHSGLWIKKMSYINQLISQGTTVTLTDKVSIDRGMTIGRPEANVIKDYFFLPAAGLYSNDLFNGAGTRGHYWSRIPYGGGGAYRLSFSAGDEAYVGNDLRNRGYLPMIAE